MIRLALLLALAALLVSAPALAAEAGAPVGVDVVLELVRSVGLPTALLLLVWYERRREAERQARTLEAVRAEHARERGEWVARLEARHVEHGELARAAVEALTESTAEIRRGAELQAEGARAAVELARAVERGAACPMREEQAQAQAPRRVGR